MTWARISESMPNVDLTAVGQTRETCEKQEKYFNGKVVTFTVQSLILYQCSVDLLTFLETLLKKFLVSGNGQIRTC